LVSERFAGSNLDDHPWTAIARAATPGRGQRIWHLKDAMGYHDVSVVLGTMRPFPMLLAQPIVETCLRIAPYIMTAGGEDRALARAAFADLTPPSISGRVQKGETTRYFAAIVAANREWICDTLRDGELANSGALSPARLRAFIDQAGKQDGTSADGLYSLIAAEVWLRNLREAKRLAAAHLAAAS
jgi:asparagine synthase (glutamine-hydrolysing)